MTTWTNAVGRTLTLGRFRGQRIRPGLVAWAYLGPALAVYVVFVLWPWATSLNYSLYDWNGIGASTFVGLDNYRRVLTDPNLLTSIQHSFFLILFFSALPILGALLLTAVIRTAPGRFGVVARAVLFIPQVIPLVAAGIAWKWMYASKGPVNQLLSALGLDEAARPWLSDFDLALPAVGLIGTWTLLGFCIVLLLAGVARIEPALYEAARLDGAGPIAEFRAITLPALRLEIGVAITVTTIAALRVFDVVFVTTQGGPGRATSVPGILVYQLAFTSNQVGLASALGVVLSVLVLTVVLLIQRLFRGVS